MLHFALAMVWLSLLCFPYAALGWYVVCGCGFLGHTDLLLSIGVF